MTEGLPPLAAVRAFEAAARHLSFTRAGEELGMTQAAVSYQIKLLEDRLGAPLFLRQPRQVVLTELGRSLAPAVGEAFELLRAAFAAARSGAQNTLTISSNPTFATQWLAPRLGSFQLAQPTLAVRLDSSTDVRDFAREEIDVSIRTGSGHWPGTAAHRLIKATFTPMLSPKLAESIGGIREPADLLKLPIIDPGDPWWPLWFKAAGIAEPSLGGRPRSQMGTQTLEATAAMAGNGVAILTPAFYQAELTAGRLIQPFDLVGYDGHAYWLVYPEARRNAPKIRAFRNWLLSTLPEEAA